MITADARSEVQQLQEKEQQRKESTTYKVMVVWTSVSLQWSFDQREALIEQMELDAGVGRGGAGASVTTSSGEPLDARSLAAQVGR